MQILYWHLRRPRRSSFGFGGQVHSPPLLQRPNLTSLLTIQDNNNNTFPEEEEEDDQQQIVEVDEVQEPEIIMEDGMMELDEGTVYLLNVMEDGGGGDQMEDPLGSYTTTTNDNNNTTTGHCIARVGMNMQQNGCSSIEETSTSQQKNGNKRKGSSVAYTTLNGDEGGYNENGNGCDFIYEERPPPILTKRPKLVVNLYEKEKGYEFGYKMSDDEEDAAVNGEVELSHLIPYAEEGFLRSIDREEVPESLFALKEDCQVYRGHVLAQINDFRFNTQANRQQNSPNKNNSSSSKAGAPIVQELILRPTIQSILTDFDRLIDTSIKARNKWKDRGSKGYGYHDETDDEDSELEFEVDLPSSLRQQADEFTYEQRLELEKELINRTSEPVCLDPSPNVGLLANRAQFERFKWREQKSSGQIKRFDHGNADETEFKPCARLFAFHNFIQGVKDKLGSVKDPEPLKLPAMVCVEPVLEIPRSQEEIIKMGQSPESSTLRSLDRDNFVKKIEEYTLETERRKRPHTTKLSIYQRNSMDCYFGELEMESFLDGPNNVKPGVVTIINKVGDPATATTKCQFELGSSRSVALYVKQFSDIFTEDGRRPCKITYQKVGQAQPQVLYTNAYKMSQAGASSSTTTAPGTSTTASSSSSSATATSATASSNQPQSPNHVAQPPTAAAVPSQPPVQIVHPQPRSVHQQQTGTVETVSVQNSSQNSNHTTVTSSVNFNVNLNSGGGMTPQIQQQILTRPQIVSVNLQPQQQQQSVTTTNNVQSQGVRPTMTQQQLLQQRLMRMKQQQQQGQQGQPTTALAKLLLTNIQPNSTGSRPITVAVQPQPQNPNNNNINNMNNSVVEAQQSIQQQTPNVNVNVNATPNNVSVNLNAITLDGLLSRGNSGGNASGQQNLRSSGAGNVPGAVNILRVNSTGGGGGQSLQRQLTMSNMNAGNVSILQTSSQPQQRIYINANSGQQIGSVTLSGGNSDVEELSVPDLNSLLNSGQGQTMSSAGLTQLASQTPSVDTHNLNLNLNVNLNSGTVVGGGDNSHSQLQASTQGSPFLVFISPLRPMPMGTAQGGGGGTRQITSLPSSSSIVSSSSSPSTLSLNLGTLQQSQSHMMSHSNMNNIVTSLASSAMSSNCVVSSQNNTTGVDGVDSIFNALSEAIGPELGQKLDGLGGNTVMIGNTPYTVSVSSGDHNNSNNNNNNQISPSVSSGGGSGGKKDGSLITLSDLLGSPTNSSSINPGLSLSSLILNASSSPSTIMVSSPQSSVSSSTSVSSTPRLSALLAGTPSADNSSNTRVPHGSPLASPNSSLITDSTTSGGSLLDRLAASLSHNSQSQQQQQRGGAGSGLNPIATATPNVVLEHPVLAATLTGTQQSPRGVSAYRQIAPAPTSSNRKH